MGRTKFDFIAEVLEKNKLTTIQKERLIGLVAREIKKMDRQDQLILEKLESISKIIESSKTNSRSNNSESTNKKLKHKPQDTYGLLSTFSKSEGGIKNLTHTFNYGFVEYDQFINQCRNEFDEGQAMFPNASNRLITRIEEFAFSESPNWYIKKGDEKIPQKTGWSEPTFVDWYKDNKLHPANDAYYEKAMIIPFKETIQVRTDTANLVRLVDELKIKVFGESPAVEVEVKESIKSAQFYTDVDSLGAALFQIFVMIKHVSSKNFCDEATIDFRQEGDFKVLYITHIGSSSTKNANDKDFTGGDLESVKNALWSLCNYDILAAFPDGYYRKVILSDNIKDLEKKGISGKWIGKNFPIEADSISGFTHVLKFY